MICPNQTLWQTRLWSSTIQRINNFIFPNPNNNLTTEDYTDLETKYGIVINYLNDTGISGLTYKDKKPFQRGNSKVLRALELDYKLQIAFPVQITEISLEDSQITNYANGDIILLANQIFINPPTSDSFSSTANNVVQTNHLLPVEDWAELKVSNCNNNTNHPFSCLVEPIYSTGLSIIDIHHTLNTKQIKNVLWVVKVV